MPPRFRVHGDRTGPALSPIGQWKRIEAQRELCALGWTAWPTHRPDQAMAIEHGVNGRSSRSLDGSSGSPCLRQLPE
jgi:hypothetical protein